ncbi:MAG: PKD domain-containing protein [Candidatus Bathyarchaeota archaeon]|jgi:PKD repeat protein
MKKSIKGVLLTLLFAALMNVVVFTPAMSAVEAEKLPTVWVKIYRIQAVDAVENDVEGEADWRYTITVSDGEILTTRDYKHEENHDDVILDRADSFIDIKNQKVSVKIALYEDDLSSSETVDISSSGTSFDCTYNLATNELSGDQTIKEEECYKTSGDDDGSTQKDENDANLWFTISDNYDAPAANAGEDRYIYTGEEVNFDGSSSTASEGSSIVKFEWDFENDGIIDAEGKTTSYTYNQKGPQTCRLVVTDSIGVMTEDTCYVNVFNRRPIADFTFSPSYPSIQDVVNLTDNSSDSDGTVTSWFWDFGDGTNSTSKNPSYTFSQKGEWQVTLTVTDNDGAETSITHTVAVVNLPPAAAFNCTTNPQTGMEIQFTDSSLDPENRSLSWFWDFGDGNTSELQAPTHKFAAEGDYNVTLIVTDDENATDTYTMTVPVTEPLQTSGSTPLWMIAVVVIVIAAIGFVGLLWWNRRRRSFPEMFAGSDGTVEFVRLVT